MTAISHTIGGDIDLTSDGSVATVSAADETRQKLLRRLCTNPGAYLWAQDYGAGLPAMVGMSKASEAISAVVQAQMALESGVDQSQPVTVSVTALNGGKYTCLIQYTDSLTQTVQALTYQTS